MTTTTDRIDRVAPPESPEYLSRLRVRRHRMADELIEIGGKLLLYHEAPLDVVEELWELADRIAAGFTLNARMVSLFDVYLADQVRYAPVSAETDDESRTFDGFAYFEQVGREILASMSEEELSRPLIVTRYDEREDEPVRLIPRRAGDL